MEFGGGQMFVTPAARLKYWKPNIHHQERFLFDMARLLVKPGETVWDVGANNGVFSVAAAGVSGDSGRVIAFEPDLWLANIVLNTAQQLPSSYARIAVISAAVANECGLAEFAIARRSRASNFLVKATGSSQSGGIRTAYGVLTLSLDSMIESISCPQVVKIDIEGAEEMALIGARRLLRDVRPRILCETGAHADRVAKIVHEHDYLMFDAEAATGSRRIIQQPTLNTLFIPQEDSLVNRIQADNV
jgi:FkbM family methyltransferase